jgi:hypothetical protein
MIALAQAVLLDQVGGYVHIARTALVASAVGGLASAARLRPF